MVAGWESAQKSGSPVTIDGYTSTARPGLLSRIGMALGLGSGIPKAFQGNVSMQIEAVQGLDMKPHSQLPSESEFLLQHGSQYTVKSVTKTKTGVSVVMAQIPPKRETKAMNKPADIRAAETVEGDEPSKEEMEDLIRFYRENPDHVGKFVSDGSEISFGGNDE